MPQFPSEVSSHLCLQYGAHSDSPRFYCRNYSPSSCELISLHVYPQQNKNTSWHLLSKNKKREREREREREEILTLCFPLIKLYLRFPFNYKTSHRVSPILYIIHFCWTSSLIILINCFFLRPPMTSISLNSRIIFHLCLISNSAFQNI